MNSLGVEFYVVFRRILFEIVIKFDVQVGVDITASESYGMFLCM
jgi:hypothetical protein